MFLKSFGNNLIFANLALLVAAWAAPQACATVVFSERDLSAHQGIDEDLSPWLEVSPAEVAHQSSTGGMTGLLILPTEEELEREAQQALLLRGKHMDTPAGMSPSPTSSLSQVSGSGSGFAIPSDLVIQPPSALQVALPPEARTILPTGPPYRWFRPPRA